MLDEAVQTNLGLSQPPVLLTTENPLQPETAENDCL